MEQAIPLTTVIDAAKALPLGRKAWVAWAADCAERALHLYETGYPDDDRPRKAIEAARMGCSPSSSRAAYAADAVRAAAYAADAAHAVRAATHTADAAAHAAFAAYAAAHAAAYAARAAAYAPAAHAADAARAALTAARAAAELTWQTVRLIHYMSKGD